MEKDNKYFYVSYEKEIFDTLTLVKRIKESDWITSDTIIVNCNPNYSSIVTQILNHKLSHLNKNELFEVLNLNMPYPNMIQVWDAEEQVYKQYIRYLADWIRRTISNSNKYLFLSSDSGTDSNFARLRTSMKGKIELDQYAFASVYLQENNYFTPDFYVEKFTDPIVYQWENFNNPNWK